MKPTALLLALLLLFCGFALHAQVESEARWVFFHDKGAALAPPDVQPDAVVRRIRQDLPFDVHDRPVVAAYLDARRAAGLRSRRVSRWLNAVSAEGPPQAWVRTQRLACVESTRPIGRIASTETLADVGQSRFLFEQLCLEEQHRQGWTGQGVRVAVFDDGFWIVDTHAAFADLRRSGRLLTHYDFVNREANVFNQGTHGLRVLSVMAANWAGQFRGTAPSARYDLLHTEDARSETRREEDYWAAAAQWADSVGAQLIQSSLVYNTFDDPTTNYRRQDLDGKTATITRAAQRAASRGLLVVNAVGNEARAPWHYILPPADGDSVLAVGSVDGRGQPSRFSSVGPTYDGRIKPDVAAPGEAVPVVSGSGDVGVGTGTSFAAPLVAGLAAGLLQAVPHARPMQVIEAIRLSGSRAANPDTLQGWGVPCATRALAELWRLTPVPPANWPQGVQLMPNPAGAYWYVRLPAGDSSTRWRFDWYDAAGRRRWAEERDNLQAGQLVSWERSQLHFEAGTYYLHVTSPRQSFWLRGLVLE